MIVFLTFLSLLQAVWAGDGIVLSPQLTETLYQLGRGDSIQATVSPNEYPEEAAKLPIVGFAFFPSLEKIIAANPRWILSDHSIENTPVERALRARERTRAHTPYVWLHVDPSSLPGFVAGIREIEKKLFNNEEIPRLQNLERCFRDLENLAKPSFSYLGIAWVQPTLLFGETSFLANVFDHLGGKNALPKDVSHPYPGVSFEWLVGNQPDVIFLLTKMGWDQGDQIQAALEPYWDFSKTKILKLNADRFGRASFTPFFHLDEIAKALGLQLPQTCLELK